MTPDEVRRGLVEALKLDLIGPDAELGAPDEVLDQPPSRFYLTGFLVPLDAAPAQRVDAFSTDELDAAGNSASADEDQAPEPAAARQKYLPSSIGLSVLVPKETKTLHARIRWGDYKFSLGGDGDGEGRDERWTRSDRQGELDLSIPSTRNRGTREFPIPGGNGLHLALAVRHVVSDGREKELPQGTRAVSVFLVNRRVPAPDEIADEAFAFQTGLEVCCEEGFVARPDFRSLESDDLDERVADLQYRDVCEYAVGHNVATEVVRDRDDGHCQCVRTCWLPQAEVERVAPAEMKGVELAMDRLGNLPDGNRARESLQPIVTEYRAWIARQDSQAPGSPLRRKETARELLSRARVAANRIEKGIALLNDPACLEAFRVANRAMATAARRRLGVMRGKTADTVLAEGAGPGAGRDARRPEPARTRSHDAPARGRRDPARAAAARARGERPRGTCLRTQWRAARAGTRAAPPAGP